MTGIVVRKAAPADARDIAAFHVKVWRDTYRDLAPAEVKARLDEAYRYGQWRERLPSAEADEIVLVAETAAGVLVGIGAAGPPSEEIFGDRGEIRFLYVDPAVKRRGIGRRLLARLAAHLAERSYTGAALGVVEGNEAAMVFYEALQGRVAGHYVDAGPTWRSRNVAFVWDDVRVLIAPG